jgi:hypothetical protein
MVQTQRIHNDTRLVTWFSRILRWSLGGLFIWVGIHFDRYWPSILFGVVFVITGFLRPKRCLSEESCNVAEMQTNQVENPGREIESF